MPVNNELHIKTHRDISLDMFRGIAVAGMLIVNLAGSRTYRYDWLKHAQWNGLTLADLVFPFFLLAVGMSLAINRYQPAPKKVLKRTVALFGLGLFLNSYPFINFSFDDIRIMGVLQRIALCYLLTVMAISFLTIIQISRAIASI